MPAAVFYVKSSNMASHMHSMYYISINPEKGVWHPRYLRMHLPSLSQGAHTPLPMTRTICPVHCSLMQYVRLHYHQASHAGMLMLLLSIAVTDCYLVKDHLYVVTGSTCNLPGTMRSPTTTSITANLWKYQVIASLVVVNDIIAPSILV